MAASDNPKVGTAMCRGFIQQIMEHGSTPLLIAAEKGYHDVVVVLLAYNTKTTQKDKNKALDLMIKKYHNDISPLIAKDGETVLDLMMNKYREDFSRLLSESGKVVDSQAEKMKMISITELKIFTAQMRASVAEGRAVTAEKRAIIAEQRATTAEETASVLEKTVTNAEERTIAAEQRAFNCEERQTAAESRAAIYEERAKSAEARAASAEERAAAAEQRAIVAEGKATSAEQKASMAEGKATLAEDRARVAANDCSIANQQLLFALKTVTAAELSATAMHRRATIAEERATAANRKSMMAEKRANVAEERATTAEERASVAEERARVAEMEVTSAEMKAINDEAKVKIFEERTNTAETAVKRMEESAHMLDIRITELVHTNEALEKKITSSEQRVQELTSLCKILQDQLDKTTTPSWLVRKGDIVLTDNELGRGGWGVVKVAKYCGLEVAAKLLHGAILSPYNQQLFKREMDISALVRHPNILLLVGATLDQPCVILTELMHTSLRAVLEDKMLKKVILSHQQVSAIAIDVGKALNYLHLMKPDAIIHRDVSSSNVLLDPLGGDMWKAKLSDFGSSNFARQVTTVGPGNYSYAAPESSDPSLQSPKMDVFSYGILLVEMSCGQFPDIQKRQDLIKQLTWSAMKTLIEECTARSPGDRPNIADVLMRLPKL